MPTVQPRASDQYVSLGFPLAGIDLSQGFGRQMPREMTNGIWGRTTPSGINVRGFDAANQRFRGGSRPGLAKYLSSAVVTGWIIQELATLVGSGYKPPGAPVQQAPSGRVVTLVAVSQGRIFYANAGDTTWTEATNKTGLTPPLNYSGLIYSAPNNQKLWFADGINWVFFDPSDGTANTWTPSSGILPVDNLNNTPRLIALWRGRIVVSGLINDPQNWFMSKVNDPTNFNYSPLSSTPQDAIAGNNAPMGLIGDVVTAIIPYSDDVLIWGGDHTIYQMSGDPQAGGALDLVTDAIGMAFGIPWCKDPYGTLYFVSNKTGIYSLVPGQQPQRISQPIEQLLLNVDTGANNFRLLWNDRYQGLHVFIAPIAGPGVTTHLFYEQRTGAWWQDQFANTNLDPLACCTFDGNTPGDRHPLIGSWDGYVRNINSTATDDDGTSIQSSVMLGPILTGNMDTMLLKDLQAALGATSGQVSFKVFVGATPEVALLSTPVAFGSWNAARNFTNQVRRSGHAVYVQISASVPWSLESVRARIATQGKVQRRGA